MTTPQLNNEIALYTKNYTSWDTATRTTCNVVITEYGSTSILVVLIIVVAIVVTVDPKIKVTTLQISIHKGTHVAIQREEAQIHCCEAGHQLKNQTNP
jgi:hypothetical protein